MIEDRQKGYKELWKAIDGIDKISSAQITGSRQEHIQNISLTLQERDHNTLTTKSKSLNYEFDLSKKTIKRISKFPIYIPNNVIYQSISPKCKYLLKIIYEQKNNYLFQIMDEDRIIFKKNLYIEQIYFDHVFGIPQWSANESRIVFIGEPIYSHEYFRKYIYRKDLGAFFTGKRDPDIYILDIEENKCERVFWGYKYGERLPSNPIFTEENNYLIVTGIERAELKYDGYMLNTRSSLILAEINREYGIKDTHPLTSVFMVLGSKFSPGYKKLCYWAAPIPYSTHTTCFQLRCITWESTENILKNIKGECVEDICILPQMMENINGGFNGVYEYEMGLALSSNGFISHNYYVFSTYNQGRILSYILNITSSQLILLGHGHSGETYILDYTLEGTILIKYSSINCPPTVYLLTLILPSLTEEPKFHSEIGIYMTPSANIPIPDTLSDLESIELETENGVPGWLWYNKKRIVGDHKLPLIIIVHGGPHSTFTNTWTNYYAYFLHLGYALIGLDYHVSIGYGLKFLEYCINREGTNIKSLGDQDTEEIYQITTLALKNYPNILNENKVFLYGASHAGYALASLSTLPQYNQLFKGVVARNPALDCYFHIHFLTDIPTLFYTENYGNLPKWPLTHDVNANMTYKTNIFRANQCTVPILFLLGVKDRRIIIHTSKLFSLFTPPHIQTSLLLFPDGHPLSHIQSQTHSFIAAALWFHKYSQLSEGKNKLINK